MFFLSTNVVPKTVRPSFISNSAAKKAALESVVPEIINNFLLRSNLFASK